MTTQPRPPGTAAPPERETVRDVPLYAWCLVGTLVFSMFSGYSQLLGLPVPPDRILFAVAVILLALDPRRPALRFQYVYPVMAAIVAWTAWSALTHGVLLQAAPLFALLDRIIVPFAMFVLGALVFTTALRRRILLATLCVLGGYLGLTAVLEIFGPHALVWPHYIVDENIGPPLGRARGPFAAAEANGMTLAMCLFAGAHVWARSAARPMMRLLAAASIALSLAGVVLCLTRSVWLGVILAVLTLGILVKPLRPRLGLLVVVCLGVGVLTLLLVPGLATSLEQRLTMASSIYDRQNTNSAGVRIALLHPLFGVGWQQFVHVVGDYVRQNPDYPLSNVSIEIHNVILSRAAETGLPGAGLLLLALLLGPVAIAWRVRTRPSRTWPHDVGLLFVAVLIVWFVPTMTSPNPYPLPNNLMWLIAGIAGQPELLQSHGALDRRYLDEEVLPSGPDAP